MAAMHEDNSPDLNVVATILKESLEVDRLYIPHFYYGVCTLNAVIISLTTFIVLFLFPLLDP